MFKHTCLVVNKNVKVSNGFGGESFMCLFRGDAQDHCTTKALKMFTTNFLNTRKVDTLSSGSNGKYLPLSVYQHMGYDIVAIAAKCTDVKQHPILGPTYRVDIDERSESNSEMFERGENHQVAPNGSQPGGTAAVTNSKEAREQARSTTAAAVQSARDQQKQRKMCEKYLSKVSAALFNLNSNLSNKVVKKMGQATQPIQAIKTQLQKLQTTLKSGMVSSVDICEADVKALLAQNDNAMKRLMSVILLHDSEVNS